MLIINPSEVPQLEHAELSATAFGVTARTRSGDPAQLAIIDAGGRVLESGEHVSLAIWRLMTIAHNQFLRGEGHLRVVYEAAAWRAQLTGAESSG